MADTSRNPQPLFSNPVRKIAIGAQFCAAACRSMWNNIVRRYAVLPVKALAQRVTDLFRGAKGGKKENESKWTRKVDFDMMPFLPDGPRPIGPLPSDPQPAYRAIPNDFMTVVIAGQRAHIPGQLREGMSLTQSFAEKEAAAAKLLAPKLPANDRLPGAFVYNVA